MTSWLPMIVSYNKPSEFSSKYPYQPIQNENGFIHWTDVNINLFLMITFKFWDFRPVALWYTDHIYTKYKSHIVLKYITLSSLPETKVCITTFNYIKCYLNIDRKQTKTAFSSAPVSQSPKSSLCSFLLPDCPISSAVCIYRGNRVIL